MSHSNAMSDSGGKAMAFLLPGVIFAIAIAARLPGINNIPPFLDEAWLLYNASAAGNIDLGDAKFLTQAIFMIPAQLAGDPVFWARIITSIAGALAAAGLYFAVRETAGITAGAIAGFMWAISPYVVFHDRLALADPWVSFFLIWSIAAAVYAYKKDSQPLAALSGFLSGLAFLAKASGLLALVWALIFFAAFRGGKETRLAKSWFAGFAPIALIGAALIASSGNAFIKLLSLHGAPGFAPVGGEGTDFTGNIFFLFENLFSYQSILFLAALVIAAAALAINREWRNLTALALAFVIPALIIAAVFGRCYPRFLLPCLPPLFVILAISAAARASVMVYALRGVLALCAILWITNAASLWANPFQKFVPPADRWQYLEGWPSGNGVRETAAFIRNQVERNPGVKVFGMGASVNLKYNLTLELMRQPRVDYAFIPPRMVGGIISGELQSGGLAVAETTDYHSLAAIESAKNGAEAVFEARRNPAGGATLQTPGAGGYRVYRIGGGQ